LNSRGESNLENINNAAAELSEELLQMAFARVLHFADIYEISAYDVPLLMSNVFFRLAVHTNATAFGLDGEDLGKRMMQVIKSAAKE
jgi:hypothetical protein